MKRKPDERGQGNKRKYTKPKLSAHGNLRGLAERVTGLNATP